MLARRLRLHHRIVLPFALTALVATSGVAYAALTVADRVLRARAEARVVDVAEQLARSNFALNPAILRSVRDIAGVDVVSFTREGVVEVATVDPPAARRVARALLGRTTAEVLHDVCAAPCAVAVRPVVANPDVRVAAVVGTADLDEAAQTVGRFVIAAALLSIVVMLAATQATARRLTRPLDRLVAFTRDVARGGDARAPAGDDEVGSLGSAFNEMLDRLQQSRDALVRSEKLALTGLLAARVAHDVRNPLSSIKMQTQLLRDRSRRGADHDATGMLDAVQRDILQVESVVQDLLELARPGELTRAPTAVAPLLGEVLEQVGPHLTYRNIDVRRDCAPDVPLVPLDAHRMKQALRNVIQNAADAMPSGGTLSVSCRVATSGEVAVEVADDGVGIDPALLSRIFDPFVSTKPHGVGLGLVNARAVVESHGGTIAVTGRQSGGTQVTFRLPVEVSRG